MKLSFYGAAGCVTGSCTLVDTGAARILGILLAPGGARQRRDGVLDGLRPPGRVARPGEAGRGRIAPDVPRLVEVDAGLHLLVDALQLRKRHRVERANLREMQRAWRASNALPQSLVEAKSLAKSFGLKCLILEKAAMEKNRKSLPLMDWRKMLESVGAGSLAGQL